QVVMRWTESTIAARKPQQVSQIVETEGNKGRKDESVRTIEQQPFRGLASLVRQTTIFRNPLCSLRSSVPFSACLLPRTGAPQVQPSGPGRRFGSRFVGLSLADGFRRRWRSGPCRLLPRQAQQRYLFLRKPGSQLRGEVPHLKPGLRFGP